MSACTLQIITLRLSPPFVRQLESETQVAKLVQGVHTIIPPSLLQLAILVLDTLGNNKGESDAAKIR